jgi:hypothetical protein
LEKLILAIILLNVIVSLIAKKRKQQAKARLKPSPKPEPGPQSPEDPEKPPQPANTGDGSVATGKNILHNVAKELGLDLETAQEPPLADDEEELQPEFTGEEEAPPETVTQEDSSKPEEFPTENWETEWSEPDKKIPGQPIWQQQAKAAMEKGRVLNLRRHLRGARSLKEAIVMKTLLDRPVSLRRRPGRGNHRIS